ncbi:CDP-diacylglycerol--glycerol-3-phosphate 3-phosphatidyltransferase [Temperatibacter marinus]|uniref:CDP-diacylglycerol--glycerol-3-phosphate 3-phosphatidyltransferase n=1 Tax=Temperatibacter marinus TaxID=1456591 RepID=A0AA52H8A3_9PROT|nr:CDP-diacylglycerol--glycerol-3-phosphate 3-phosphatidyltransferase [Temperatibacter marinus]WND01629.1 CDP-diacylglycerol--glycerol-3-phosphate 3-phosphatidyltransferase [Temperatibacter marinus]
MWTLPNILTLMRILVIPFLVAAFFMEDKILASHISWALFALAGITDFFDGWLARAQGLVSKIGQFLDPIADKLMVGAVIIMLVGSDTLTGLHIIPAVVIMCRELLVSGLREFLAGAQVSVPVTVAAKWKTTVQMISLAALLWIDGTMDLWEPLGILCFWVAYAGIWFAAALTLYTGIDYLKEGLKHMKD